MEHLSLPSQRKLRKQAAAAGLAALAFGLAGCSGSSAPAEHIPSTTEKTTTATTNLTPNMVRFLKPGTNDTCFNGAPRPCALLLRTEPKLASEYINVDPRESRVTWPLEAYKGQAGDSLTIRCYANGQKITPYEGSESSSAWYELAIPQQYVLNPTVKAELNKPSPSINTLQQDGQAAILGWASVEWFNQSAPAPNVPACTS